MGLQTSAHAVSLPLFALLEKLSQKSQEEALSELTQEIKVLGLEEHLVPFIAPDGDIHLNPKTELGKDILSELMARSHFLPCPEGDCEYGSSGACRWCGRMKK